MPDSRTGKEQPSKSQRKREHRLVQELAAALAALPVRDIKKLAIAEVTREELQLASRMTASGARVRQLRHIAKLLEADEDLVALNALLEQRRKPGQQAAARQRQIEKLRTMLLGGDSSAVEELLIEHPELPAAELRLQTREAIDEQRHGKPRGAGRALFRLLAQHLQTPEN